MGCFNFKRGERPTFFLCHICHIFAIYWPYVDPICHIQAKKFFQYLKSSKKSQVITLKKNEAIINKLIIVIKI